MGFDKSKEERFEEIYREYRHDVYKISLYYTRNEYEAEDITQKVFYKLYEHFDEIHLENARAYVFRAARNLSYNWLRDAKRDTDGENIDTVPEETFIIPSVEHEYLHEETDRQKKEFFSMLMKRLYEENEMWYDILNYLYCLDMSHDDAAEAVGIPKSVMYSKLYRAKQWLRRNYAEEFHELIQ